MLEVRNIGFPIAPVFIYVRIPDFAFLDFLDSDKFLLLALSPPPTTLLSLALSFFKAKSDDLIIFNIEISGTALLLKPWIKRQ